MSSDRVETYPAPTITVEDSFPAIGKDAVVESIYSGLTSVPKRISSMFFYDGVGSKLFEKITRLPEYYLTRTEKKLLKEISRCMGKSLRDVDIVEIGSGDCSKISILLDAVPEDHIETIRYMPVDISRRTIEEAAGILVKKYPGLSIHGFVADFMKPLDGIPEGKKRLICFLGSTLGNLTRRQSIQFFSNIGHIMQSGDVFLLGVDRVKPRSILEKAYNDSQGVTAAFNRNILNVVNTVTASNFDPGAFQHIAFYNDTFSRIEMHVQAMTDMVISSVRFPEDIFIEQGERIHTENSHKFTQTDIYDLAGASGLRIESILSDENNWYSLIRFIK